MKKLDTDVQKKIISTLQRIKIRPHTHVTKLVDDPGYRLRVGDYRVILDVDEGKRIILVIKISHRKKICK
ncbi:MAG: type II toxin-antitoxin system RelE/ParE family toxin [Methanosarcinales archaeon]|nr:type II toxin-antitoxin system RelE/ParE family toxin [Methanosarcinales archaeon]